MLDFGGSGDGGGEGRWREEGEVPAEDRGVGLRLEFRSALK